MTTTPDQIRSDPGLKIECCAGKAPGTVIVRLSGPLTERKMFEAQSLDTERNLFHFQFQPDSDSHNREIFDLSDVPFIDSMGMGSIVTEHVRCQQKGISLVLAGANPRVRELLKLTRVDKLLPVSDTVEEADTD